MWEPLPLVFLCSPSSRRSDLSSESCAERRVSGPSAVCDVQVGQGRRADTCWGRAGGWWVKWLGSWADRSSENRLWIIGEQQVEDTTPVPSSLRTEVYRTNSRGQITTASHADQSATENSPQRKLRLFLFHQPQWDLLTLMMLTSEGLQVKGSFYRSVTNQGRICHWLEPIYTSIFSSCKYFTIKPLFQTNERIRSTETLECFLFWHAYRKYLYVCDINSTEKH